MPGDTTAAKDAAPFTEQLDKLESVISDCIETLDRLEPACDRAQITEAGTGVQARLDRCLQKSGSLADLCRDVVRRVGTL